MGLYYAVPLLGPSLGPVIGGLLTKGFSWRATFYFLAAFGGVSFCSFLFFPDSYRRERSHIYQAATKRALKRALAHHENVEKKRIKKIRRGLSSSDPTPGTTVPPTPTARTGFHTPAEEEDTLVASSTLGAKSGSPTTEPSGTPTSTDVLAHERAIQDVGDMHPVMKRRHWKFWKKRKSTEHDDNEIEIQLSLKDVNPLPAMWHILKRPNNFLGVVCSGKIIISDAFAESSSILRVQDAFLPSSTPWHSRERSCSRSEHLWCRPVVSYTHYADAGLLTTIQLSKLDWLSSHLVCLSLRAIALIHVEAPLDRRG